MRDNLIQVTNLAQAKTKLVSYLRKNEFDQDEFRLPQWCDILPVDAYTAFATYDAQGNETSPAIQAAGKWFILSFDRQRIPAALDSVIKAQAEREEGLVLPPGIVGLSTMWAGMKIRQL